MQESVELIRLWLRGIPPLNWLKCCLLIGQLVRRTESPYPVLCMIRATACLLLLFCPIVTFGDPGNLDFNRDVRPILSENCFHCHGPDTATRQADLRLDLADSAMTVVDKDDPESSELIRRVLSHDPDELMPPPESLKQITPEQKEILKKWIQEGGSFESHWSFTPPSSTPPPQVANDTWSNGPIDQFILARLRAENLTPSAPAKRETLARRISLDLTGVPLSPQEMADFLGDTSEASLETLIERLMHSPRYGEHMAIRWLEASRYADTDGYQNDRYRYQHVWRDWVIDAFNENKPYDQFAIEQIAGDMLPNATLRQQIATGFGRNHRINSEDGSIPEEWRTENVVDRIDTFGTIFLGLTIGCARCHDHKSDPISQREYYELFAYFNNVAEWGVGPNNGNSPPFIEVPKSWPNLDPEEDRLIHPDPVKLRNARADQGNGLKRPQAGSPSTLMIMHELDQPRETFVLQRGQYNMPDRSSPVQAGVPDSLSHATETPPTNRLELARWLFDPSHPLTARVAVNRIWQQFFSAGLVETSENFGSQGSPPSHPQLLDWLALELIRNDWNIRAIQKQILLSQTYQQSSHFRPELRERDPQNQLHARGPRSRLPAFTLRDQALAVSGLLVEKIGGPSTKPYMPPKIWKSISNNNYKQEQGSNLYRRSLYTYWRRTIPPPTMMNFNAAAREVCVVRTETTNTPLQALTLMNNKLFIEAARCLAERMWISRNGNSAQAIQAGYQLTVGREATPAELKIMSQTHKTFLSHFRENPAEAKLLLAVGEKQRDQTIPVVQHAAMTMIANILLNLDETISKE